MIGVRIAVIIVHTPLQGADVEARGGEVHGGELFRGLGEQFTKVNRDTCGSDLHASHACGGAP